MEDENSQTISALFAAATERPENAHEASIEGQSQKRSPDAVALCAERLRTAARQAITLIDAALILARDGDREP
jgi:hypothetical protein